MCYQFCPNFDLFVVSIKEKKKKKKKKKGKNHCPLSRRLQTR